MEGGFLSQGEAPTEINDAHACEEEGAALRQHARGAAARGASLYFRGI